MFGRSVVALSVLLLLVFSFCTKLSERPPAEDALAMEPLPEVGAVPSAWGKLISATHGGETNLVRVRRSHPGRPAAHLPLLAGRAGRSLSRYRGRSHGCAGRASHDYRMATEG